MEFFEELWLFLKVRKKFWMILIFAVLLLFGGLVLAAKGSSMGVFIYTISRPYMIVLGISAFIMTAPPPSSRTAISSPQHRKSVLHA